MRPTRAKISTQNTLNTFLSIHLAVEATNSVFVHGSMPDALAVTCDQAFYFFFGKGEGKKIARDTFSVRPATNRPLIEINQGWLNCHLRASQDSPAVKSVHFHATRKMYAEYNLYS